MYRPCDALGFSIKGVLMRLCKYVCYSGVIVHSGSVVGEIGLILIPDCKVSPNLKSIMFQLTYKIWGGYAPLRL